MRFGVAALILLLAACGTSKKTDYVSAEEEILRRYADANDQGTNGDSEAILNSLPEALRFRLAVWLRNKLHGANILITLQMQKDTNGRIDDIRDKLDLYKTPGGRHVEELRERLLLELELESARLALINRHLPIAGLPEDDLEKLNTWRDSALASADFNSLQEMRRTSARRILWLENKIKELQTHHQDVVWDDYMHYSLLLRFEVLKLGNIEKRLSGNG